MAEKKYAKPLPRIDEESKGFWEACERGELYVQRCEDCGTIRFYPRGLCPECLSAQTEWLRCAGTGSIYTFTVVYQNQMGGFRDQLPYVLAYVELDEGPRLLTNIEGCKPEEVHIGMRVEVRFDEVSPAVTLPKFVPVLKPDSV